MHSGLSYYYSAIFTQICLLAPSVAILALFLVAAISRMLDPHANEVSDDSDETCWWLDISL